MFSKNGIIINGIKNLTPIESRDCFYNGAILIDIRRDFEAEYKQFDVPEIYYIKRNQFETDIESLDKNKSYIIADSTGTQSQAYARIMVEKGFNNVASLIGGIMEWHRDNLPVKINTQSSLAKPSFYHSTPKNHLKTTLGKNDNK